MSMDNSNGLNRDQLITLGDLEKFKIDLLSEFRLLQDGSRQHQAKQWIRSSEVRRMLSVSAGTLQNFRVNGTLPYTKIGGIVFYKYDDIVRLLENNKVSNSVERG